MEGSVYQYYANVRTEPVEWLWYPYIPLGKLTVLQGDPGEGKSTFALNVVARITTGQPMPDGVPAKGKRVAIYQCAEDGIADTIKPRLQQAGADCERVAYIIDNDIALTLEDGRIETAIKDTHASVFIIDPIQAFIPPDADMQSATKMRSVLRKLANIADRNKCAVILIGHMNKGGSSKSLYRGLGSIDIAAIEVTDAVYEAYMKGDRKMRYFENDLKAERILLDEDGQIKQIILSREDSLDRLMDDNAEQFSDRHESVEDMVLRKISVERLHTALSTLSEKERELIETLFFEEKTERDVASAMGISQPAVHKQKNKILKKLKLFLEN